MKEENNIKALDELHKGACMGMDAVKYILDQTEDDELKGFLERNYGKYKDLAGKIEKIYHKYSDKEPQETNAMTKAMTWYNLKLKTITDNTSSKLAEILFQGFTMGISEGIKILNHKEVDKDIEKIAKEYVDLQEQSIDAIKKFL